MTTEVQAILDWMRGLEQTPGCERAQAQLAQLREADNALAARVDEYLEGKWLGRGLIDAAIAWRASRVTT